MARSLGSLVGDGVCLRGARACKLSGGYVGERRRLDYDRARRQLEHGREKSSKKLNELEHDYATVRRTT